MEALCFVKGVQKTSLSGELRRAHILLFEKFILLFDILTFKRDLFFFLKDMNKCIFIFFGIC